MSALRVLLLISLICILQSTSMANFKCSSTSKCDAIIDYVSVNATTISHIASQFGVSELRSIFGVNSLPANTSGTYPIPAKRAIKIPFPCLCSNGKGISDNKPIYTVVPNDGLFHIASEVFGGLMTYQDIADVNNITDVNKIYVAQKLWIPLPCSCDDVGGEKVVHYGYVVPSGSSVSQIAQTYGTTEATLLSINGIANASALQAGQVLDVPLKACKSSVNSTSLDYPMVLANGTYRFTANNCVMCKCTPANNYTLECQASGLKSSKWSSCPSIHCSGLSNVTDLGNFTTSSCGKTTCAYAGYTQTTILTTLDQDSTCAGNLFHKKFSS
ncbi:hypothetical protein V2J09_020068 [Rumex salicifolius]